MTRNVAAWKSPALDPVLNCDPTEDFHFILFIYQSDIYQCYKLFMVLHVMYFCITCNKYIVA